MMHLKQLKKKTPAELVEMAEENRHLIRATLADLGLLP